MSELQERTFHSENDKRRFTLSFSPDRLFFTISWRNNRGINASHFNILRDEAISVAEDILDRYKPAESAPAARDEGWSMASIHRELSEAAERSRPVTLSAAEARTVLDTLAEAERNNTIAWEAVHKIANYSIGQLAARIDAENMRDLARSAREKAALLAHEAPKEGA